MTRRAIFAAKRSDASKSTRAELFIVYFFFRLLSQLLLLMVFPGDVKSWVTLDKGWIIESSFHKVKFPLICTT